MRAPTKNELGAAIAAATLIATPMVAKWEGLRLDPYLDVGSVPTVCYGETRVEMRHYSKAECDLMLQKALAKGYAPAVARAVPAIRDRPRVFAASIILAYNIGTGNFAKSTAARRFNRGDWRGGCDAFLFWNTVKGKVVRGLANRRADERKLCLAGL